MRKNNNFKKQKDCRLFSLSLLLFLIAIIILGLTVNSSTTLWVAATAATAADDATDVDKDVDKDKDEEDKKEEITRENILSKISLAAQWLSEKQRPDGSWPIVTQDKRSSVVATGLFALGIFGQKDNNHRSNRSRDKGEGDYQNYLLPALTVLPDTQKALSFLLAHQEEEGYWEDPSSFPWNEVEATIAALYGLISVGYEGTALNQGMDWLIKNQEPNGSWNDDCWDTSWALYLLYRYNYSTSDPIIQAAAQWLAEDQKKNGSWESDLPHLKRFEPLWTTPPAIFALAQTDQYQDNLVKGLEYLKEEQNKNGSFGRKDASKTGLALMAFCSLSHYPDLLAEYKPSAEKAVQWFLSNQRASGTWPGGFHTFDIIDTSFSIWGLNKFLSSIFF